MQRRRAQIRAQEASGWDWNRTIRTVLAIVNQAGPRLQASPGAGASG